MMGMLVIITKAKGHVCFDSIKDKNPRMYQIALESLFCQRAEKQPTKLSGFASSNLVTVVPW